jgi:predicted CXXCH cytochrome family protein
VAACLALLLASLWPHPAWAQKSVVDSKHNLTGGGTGQVKVGGRSESCVYCHTPHASNPMAPLWNRADSGQFYDTYESPTLKADVRQPSGASRLCLSCHDGTVALNQTYNPRNSPATAIYLAPGDRGYIGTDLRDDHPISFRYDAALVSRRAELHDPGNLPRHLPLDDDQQLQCTTCHDPHDDTNGQFLRMSNLESRMCVSCHNLADWSTSPHATSTAALSNATRDTWENLPNVSTVRQAGCQSCHRSHSGGGRPWLLRRDVEEDNCYACHDGTVAKDVLTSMQKASAHPVGATVGAHRPNENLDSMPQHVECSDCHAPHRIQANVAASAPIINPTMRGVSGKNRNGTLVEDAQYEYQVCYKCHAGVNPVGNATVNRVIPNADVGQAFDPSNQSFHPVEFSTGRAGPSLLQNYNSGSMLYCTSCHNSGSTVKGPHGSNFAPLLGANYTTLDNTAESSQAYALCYSCHNRQSILNNESFSEHRRHIVDKRVPCSVCHDPHGVRENSNLINFDRDVVEAPGPGVSIEYKDTGNKRGSCTVKCHGETHVNEQYPDD